MKTFDDLKFDTPNQIAGGKQAKISFANGFGASVIQNRFSYGNEDGLYELAVLDKDGHLTYETTVTSDVIGCCTEQDITKILKSIQELTAIE